MLGAIARLTGLGAGATWPGEIALRLRPGILSELTSLRKTIILVTGTNGKTTTVKMIETILCSSGKKVRRNPSGANLDNGLVSGFIEDASWLGDLRSEYFVFEVDEATFSKVAAEVSPRIVVLLNLFRDQLDRYGEVDAVAERWATTLQKLDSRTHILINGDDPQLAFIGLHLAQKVSYFGLDDPTLFLSKMQHATDSIYCPKCGYRLTFGGMYFSHLGKWACGRCGLTHPDLMVTARDYDSPIEGIYNKYNTLAAASTTKILGLLPDEIQKGLLAFRPAFGRLEKITYKGRSVKILLSKNPTGFNESLRTVEASQDKGPLVLVLNDRIPDGTDVSWIWDVDFENLTYTAGNGNVENSQIYLSGDRSWDLAVRLKHAGIKKDYLHPYENLEDAVENAITAAKESEVVWVLPTYSAMLEVRRIFTGNEFS